MKHKLKQLTVCISIPLAVGIISALISNSGMTAFGMTKQPPLSPPAWSFPVVWTFLYILMGIASYLVLKSMLPTEKALKLYVIQLIFNFFWSIIFFNFEMYLFAFIWLSALLVLIICTTVAFSKHSRTAAYLMLPYIIWVTFAGYLNLAVYIISR